MLSTITEKQLKYWESLKGKSPIGINNLGKEPWNKGVHIYLGGKKFEKGRIPWNKGLKGYHEEENHPLWKGQNAGYVSIHKWVRKHLGTPALCSNCKTTISKKFEWHNISGLNLRILSDWLRLCRKCHYKTDYGQRRVRQF